MSSYSRFVNAVILSASKVSCTLKVRIGWKDNASESPVYASVRLGSPAQTVPEALSALGKMGDAMVRVSLPRIGDADIVVLTLAPTLKAKDAAVLFSHQAGLSLPDNIDGEYAASVLAKAGLTEANIDSKPVARKGKGKGKETVESNGSTVETVPATI